MALKGLIKAIISKGSEYFLFFIFDNLSEKILLIISRILRKLLFRESLIEVQRFQNYGQYRDFLKIVLDTHSREFKEYQTTNAINVLDFERVEQKYKIKEKKVLFVCCDGGQNSKRTVPATFLDVWRDTAEEAGLKTRVSIANDFMYNPQTENLIGKNKCVSNLIKSINSFKPNLLLFDINFKPSEFTINVDDIDRIKKKQVCCVSGT